MFKISDDYVITFRDENLKDKFDLSFSFSLRAKIYIQATKVR